MLKPILAVTASTLVAAALAAACGSDDGATDLAAQPDGSTATDAASSDAPLFGDTNSDGSAPTCEPPDMLLVLDRTLTMHRQPDGRVPPVGAPQRSKFWQAIEAIELLVAAPLDQTLRFGLELWPRNPGVINGEEACLTLAERISDARLSTNVHCEGPEIAVPTGIGTGAQITALLDPNTTRICGTTPTGAALQGALAELTRVRAAGRPQTMVLITDGADWDQTCPLPDPRPIVGAAAAEGILTFVVGFDAQGDAGLGNGVGKPFLNDMACAGKTAKDYATACVADPNAPGGSRAVDPNSAPLFYLASSGQDLAASLRAAAGTVCCNCVK